jgi:hypothetical protein
MGMLFNTQATIDVRDGANTAFKNAAGGIAALRADPNWALAFGALPGPSTNNPAGGTFNLITSNHLPHPFPTSIVPSNAGKMLRWSTWVGFLDTQTNALDPGNFISQTIGAAIQAGLNNNPHPYAQIEFYVVPDPNSASTSISAQASDFQDANGEWSKIIYNLYSAAGPCARRRFGRSSSRPAWTSKIEPIGLAPSHCNPKQLV